MNKEKIIPIFYAYDLNYLPYNINYIKRFLNEICYGGINHFVSMFLGILIIFIPWFNPI